MSIFVYLSMVILFSDGYDCSWDWSCSIFWYGKNPFSKSILIPSQTNSFWECYKDFSWRIPDSVGFCFGKRFGKVEAFPNPSSKKTDILCLSVSRNFTKLHIIVVKINETEHRPKGKTLKTKYLFFSLKFHAEPKNLWWFSFISMWWYPCLMSNSNKNFPFLNILPLFYNCQISFCCYPHAYWHVRKLLCWTRKNMICSGRNALLHKGLLP